MTTITRYPPQRPKPCARLACDRKLYHRLGETPYKWRRRKFCSIDCRLRCRKWGKQAEAEKDPAELVA